jgi:hypothetical protein
MANKDNPNGLKPVRVNKGTAPEITEGFGKVGSTFYEGMIICRNKTGEMVPVTNANILAANIAGVAAHYLVSATGTENKKLKYYSDPEQRYVIQCNGTAISSRSGYMDMLFPITNLTTGNTTTLQSKGELAGQSGTSVLACTTSANQPLHCLELYGGIDNTSNASWTRYIVKIVPSLHLRGLNSIGILAATNVYTGQDAA